MVQGTASGVGKSLLVTALARLYSRAGVRVAPFKAWNMSNNAFATYDGHEMARAQAEQAFAAGVPPSPDMNPVLVKPEAEGRCQLVLDGKAVGSLSPEEYRARIPSMDAAIDAALARLREAFDLVLIEGAGCPSELNMTHDIANMAVARRADAPVIVVGDADRCGVFASLYGTVALLPAEDRERVRGLVINRLSGDASLLSDGPAELARRTGIPVLGVVPMIPAVRLADEDGLALDDRHHRRRPGPDRIDVAVVRTPFISNCDDFGPLEQEADVVVRFVRTVEEARGADLLCLPGTKSTAADLAWLRAGGLADLVKERAARQEPVLGICGGCQMLGRAIHDPELLEATEPVAEGLGILPLETRYSRPKVAAQVSARMQKPTFLTDGQVLEGDILGYEIHTGHLVPDDPGAAPFVLGSRNGVGMEVADGGVGAAGSVVGTMIHGILENDEVRHALLAHLRRRKGLKAPKDAARRSRLAELDRIAAIVETHLDMPSVARLAGVPLPR